MAMAENTKTFYMLIFIVMCSIIMLRIRLDRRKHQSTINSLIDPTAISHVSTLVFPCTSITLYAVNYT